MPKRERKKAKNKNPVPSSPLMGRPTKYRPEYCEMLIKHQMQGLSFKSFAAVIFNHSQEPVSVETMNQWAASHPEFSAAKEAGAAQERLALERLGLTGMAGALKRIEKEIVIPAETGPDGKVTKPERRSVSYAPATFGQTAWLFSMKNKFPQDYRDRKDIELSGKEGGAPITVKDATEARTLLKRLAPLLGDDEEE